MIEFRTFGVIDLRDAEGVAIRSVLAQPKRLALLAYLAAARPPGLHRRDTLLGLFWPDQEEARGRAALRKSLHHLGRSLGAGVIAGRGDEAVGVDPERFRCDAAEFEAALEAGDTVRALNLYRGDFLRGLFGCDTLGFERWVEERRRELRDRAVEAAWAQAEREIEGSNPVGAAHWGRRAAAFDPYGEAGLRRLLVLLDGVGDRGGALRAYAKFARRMAAEEAEPSPETMALVQRIRARTEPIPIAEAAPSREAALSRPVVPKAVRAPLTRAWEPSELPPRADRPPGRPGSTARRRTAAASAGAAALLTTMTGGYMAMRALESGESGGSSGALAEGGPWDGRATVLLADFESSDAGLARAATEALRIDLSQAQALRLAAPEDVRDALRRMERSPDAPLDAGTARELALREGFPAVVRGEIHEAGPGYLFSVELLSPHSGRVLSSHRAAAADSTAILGAIDALSEELRERLGESARRLRGEPPLEQVTTSDLEALRLFSLAMADLLGDVHLDRGIALLEEAISLDTAFAAAHATLGVVLAAMGQERSRVVEALTRAYRHRDRLSERERLWLAAHYQRDILGEPLRAATTYESLLELEAGRAPPTDLADLHAELADVHLRLRNYPRAEELGLRAIALDSSRFTRYWVTAEAQARQGRLEDARATLALHLARVPENPASLGLMAHLQASAGDYAAAERGFRAIRETPTTDRFRHVATSVNLAALAAVRGRLRAATAYLEEAMEGNARRDLPGEVLRTAAWASQLDIEVGSDPERALARLEAALDRFPLSGIPPLDCPYPELADVYARAGDPGRARRLLEQFEAEMPEGARHVPRDPDHVLAIVSLDHARGTLALAEGRFADAEKAYRRADVGKCRLCVLPMLARTYDRWGRADSAVAVYERYLDTPGPYRLWTGDALHLAAVHERLARLYEAKGDLGRAARYHERFAELWTEADEELRPRVRAALERARAMTRD